MTAFVSGAREVAFRTAAGREHAVSSALRAISERPRAQVAVLAALQARAVTRRGLVVPVLADAVGEVRQSAKATGEAELQARGTV